MQLGFTRLYAGIAPPTPTLRFDFIWQPQDARPCHTRSDACLTCRNICISRGDDVRFIGTAKDRAGNLEDIAGASEIIFAIYDKRGGAELLRASMSDDEVFIGARHEFYFSIRTADSLTFSRRSNWHETIIANSDGWRRTVMQGTFEANQTNIGALV